MFIVRIRKGLRPQSGQSFSDEKGGDQNLHAFFFLVSSEKRATQHLRFLAHIAEMIDKEDFLEKWIDARDEGELRKVLLRDERFLTVKVRAEKRSGKLIGKKVSEIDLPGECLITIIRRNDGIVIPRGYTEIKQNDELFIIGEVDEIEDLQNLQNEIDNES
jgi:K+/H+ antiporter YhaU regulatory subunit KhtT